MTHHQAAALVEYLRQLAIHTNPDAMAIRINVVLAAGTLLTFFATAFMAYRTSQLAKETVRASAWADRHHQEDLSPILFVRAAIMRRVLGGASGESSDVVFYQRGSIENVGRGPAFNVRVKFEWSEGSDDWVIPLIASGSVVEISRDRRLAKPERAPANASQVDDLANFGSRVDFTNIFGSEGHIVQRKTDGGDLLVIETRMTKFLERSKEL